LPHVIVRSSSRRKWLKSAGASEGGLVSQRLEEGAQVVDGRAQDLGRLLEATVAQGVERAQGARRVGLEADDADAGSGAREAVAYRAPRARGRESRGLEPEAVVTPSFTVPSGGASASRRHRRLFEGFLREYEAEGRG
jgi:hypothetical protein